MTNRENLIAALDGKKPERIPFTIYEDFGLTNPELDIFKKQGLSETSYCSFIKETTSNVEKIIRTEENEGKKTEFITLRTPVGEISQISKNGWVQEFYLKTPEDYKVMEYIIHDTKLEADHQQYNEAEKRAGDNGITLIWGRRSPMQTILVDYVGLEEFAYHLADDFLEMEALREALLEQMIESYKIFAEGPGKYIHMLENFTAETWGPERFTKYHLPVYEKVIPILHKAGKKVYTHFDGKLACVADLVAKTGIDGIESLTLPPEGDMQYAQARKIWPEKFLWSNISLGHYNLSDSELREKIKTYVHQAAPDGRNLAFAILEDIPPNWKTKIPVILETLAEIKL